MGLNAWALLLWPRWRAVVNQPRSRDGRSPLRLLIFATLGAAFMWGGFAGARWLFSRFLEVEFLAELLIRRVLGIVLLFFSGLLIFSNVITAFSTLYLADDLPLLVTAPVSTGRLYLARLLDTWAQSSWMMLVFALPILAGCGPVLGAGWWFYVALPLVVLPLTVLCSVAGTSITMLLARWLPAHRTQDVLVVLAMIGFLVVYVAFRLAEPERFLNPDGFDDLVALVGSLRTAGPSASPTEWTLETLFWLARGEPANALPSALVLATAAPAACAVGAWLSRAIYLRSFSLAQEGRGDTQASVWRRLASTVGARLKARYPRSVRHAFAQRDTRVFFRTTGQWTQLLMIGALVVVYVFNFKHFRTLETTGMLGQTALFFINICLGGLVVTTIAVRFLYPSVSLEGRAFWVVRTAPIDPATLLKAKVRLAFGPLLMLSLLLTLSSNLVVELPLSMHLASAVIALLTTYALTGMAVGLGATDPRFHEDNPARIASGVGGVVFMLLGLLYLAVVLALLSRPLDVLRAMIDNGFRPPLGRALAHTARVAGALAVTLLAHHLPLIAGARALRRRED